MVIVLGEAIFGIVCPGLTTKLVSPRPLFSVFTETLTILSCEDARGDGLLEKRQKWRQEICTQGPNAHLWGPYTKQYYQVI